MPTDVEVEPEWRRAFAWVEATLGGRVVRAERQPRWRPAWFLDVERDGEVVPLYWRGDRGQGDVHEMFGLRKEADVLRVLEEHGVPVPHVYGYCEDPLGILMARCPGIADFHLAGAAEREQVADDFLRALARWHTIPPERFEAIGLERPRSARDQALLQLRVWEAGYRKVASAPAPLIELALRWLHDHVPATAGPTVLVQGDTGPGQFLFEHGRVTAVIDWEFCHLGDPMYDLALIRGRDISYPFGDLRQRFARYAELSGNELDLERLRYYCVLAMLTTPIGLYPALVYRPPGLDYAQYLAWNAVYSRVMVECLAEATGTELEAVELPVETPTPRSWIHDVVVDALRTEIAPNETDEFRRYRVESVALLADHLRFAERAGAAYDEADLDDAAVLLGGTRPDTRADTDVAVQELVLSADPGRDVELIRYFHRRAVRDEALLAPLLGELRETATLSPIG